MTPECTPGRNPFDQFADPPLIPLPEPFARIIHVLLILLLVLIVLYVILMLLGSVVSLPVWLHVR